MNKIKSQYLISLIFDISLENILILFTKNTLYGQTYSPTWGQT